MLTLHNKLPNFMCKTLPLSMRCSTLNAVALVPNCAGPRKP